MKHAIIIQARLTSTRFPKKVLFKLSGKSLVEILYGRLNKFFESSQIIFAIPDTKENDELEKEIKNFATNIFRGPELDVLKRYYSCAKENSLTHITRITADCPMICGELIIRNINAFKCNDINYSSNTLTPTFPDGLDCETFTFTALDEANQFATSEHDREHVTPFIKRNYKTYSVENDTDLSEYRMTVDYTEDLEIIDNMVNEIGMYANLESILNFEFRQNKSGNIQRNEGSTMSGDQKLWQRAKTVIPGGNQFFSKRPRQLNNIKSPIYYRSATKTEITTLEGKIYSDYYLMGVGTNSLGYSDPDVNSRVITAIENSTTSSLNSILEVELAERLISISPGMDMAKFAKTGAEANAIALRISRSYNRKEGVALCGYHGWHDWYLSANLSDGSKLNNHLFQGVQLSGVPDSMADSVHAFEYNDIGRLKSILEEEDISCVIMEVQRNVPPSDNFLEQVRQLCTKENVVLIFDECSSGFRETFGGLYKKYNVIPDMVMFGKAMTNGFPLTVVLGQREIMECAENTFISSTYFSESTGYAAGIATLDKMEKLKSWEITKENGLIFKRLWANVLNESGLDYNIIGLDAMPKFHIESIDFKSFIDHLSSKMLDANILAYETIYPCIYHNTEESSFSNYGVVFEEAISYLCDNIEKFQIDSKRVIGMKRLN